MRKIQSKLSKSFEKIISKKFWALTGTPIENNIDDLINLSQFIIPGSLSKSDKKRSHLVIREIIKPHVLRRNKASVLKELPEVKEFDVSVELHEDQKVIYEDIWSKRKELSKKSGSFFSVLAQLRAICDGDSRYASNSKVLKAYEIITDIFKRKEKVIVFSYYLEPLRALENLLSDKGVDFVTILGEDELADRN